MLTEVELFAKELAKRYIGRAPTGVRILSAGPNLATAGTGDVLSGAIGAFVARGVGQLEAAALGAHVHGRAAGLGPPEGLVAGDIPDLLARWLSMELYSGLARRD